MKYFKIINVGTSLLFIYLFVTLLFTPGEFVEGVGLEACVSSIVLGRRASVLMLGFGILLFFFRNLTIPRDRIMLSSVIAIVFASFAFAGGFEYLRGTMNTEIFQAIIIECIVVLLYMYAMIRDLKSLKFNR